jgi:tellurite resistance protein TerC
MLIQYLPWIGFNIFVVAMLALDLGVFNRNAHEIKIKEAAIWSTVWIGLALLFGVGVWHFEGAIKAGEFFTGYVIEKSLSVDNIFVMLLLFNSFKVPSKYQHKVLFYGIVGALVMRAFFIFAGVSLIHKFHSIIYIFGAFLIFTGIKMLFADQKEIDFEKNLVLRLARQFFPVTPDYVDGKFWVKTATKTVITPLLLVLLMVETMDLIFAVDSIPAILAISHDPFIVYTSNVFAILGLRSLFFALSGMVSKFHYLTPALAAILCFVGTKMLISGIYTISVGTSLTVILSLLTIAILASWIRSSRQS